MTISSPEPTPSDTNTNASIMNNEYADFWRYDIGVNVIPADTRKKVTYESWLEWQDKPIPEEVHNEWKARGVFNKGMAVILGKVWHNKQKLGLYLNGLDADNLKAIEEVCTRDSKTISLTELAKWTLVEQHLDDTNKAHIYVYSHKPFVKKSSDKISTELISKINSNEIPAIEVKGLGSHGISFVTPSFHKNGLPYEIIGTKEPVIANDFERHIDNICRKYSIPYLDAAEDNNGNGKAQTPIEDLFKEDCKVLEGHNRHEALLRAMESLLTRNLKILSLEKIKEFVKEWNNEHCIPSLDDREFEKQWKCAIYF